MDTTFQSKTIPIKIWNGEILKGSFGFDTETDLIIGHEVPRLVCGSAYDGETGYFIAGESMAEFMRLNVNDQHRLLMHSAAFDSKVLDKAVGTNLEALSRAGRVLDIGILYRLMKIAETGEAPYKYNLDLLTKHYCHETLDKSELIRLTFGNGHLTNSHIIYAVRDAIATYSVAKVLTAKTRKIEGDGPYKMLGHRLQLLASYALEEMQDSPLRVDIAQTQTLKKNVESEMMKAAIGLADFGYYVTRDKQTPVFNRILSKLAEEQGIPLEYTESCDVKQSKEFLTHIDSPFVKYFINYKSNQKLVSTFIKPLLKGEGLIYPRYQLLKGTGRTSSYGPNIQQQPRVGGIRECILPLEGMNFLSADYDYIELCTLAQWLLDMFGSSTLAEMINSGADPHYATASRLLNKPIKLITEEERQHAKALNFGIPGGLSPKALKAYAEVSYGVRMSDTESEMWHEKWLSLMPDVAQYLRMQWKDVIFPSGRRRGQCGFTDGHNTPFQGLAADGAKMALYYNHLDGTGNSYFVHDEIGTMVPAGLDNYYDLCEHFTHNMIKGMRYACPKIRIGAESLVMDRWYKDAKRVEENGKVLCYAK